MAAQSIASSDSLISLVLGVIILRNMFMRIKRSVS